MTSSELEPSLRILSLLTTSALAAVVIAALSTQATGSSAHIWRSDSRWRSANRRTAKSSVCFCELPLFFPVEQTPSTTPWCTGEASCTPRQTWVSGCARPGGLPAWGPEQRPSFSVGWERCLLDRGFRCIPRVRCILSTLPVEKGPKTKRVRRRRTAAMADERVLDVLRKAHDEVERRVAGELSKALGAASTARRELDDARNRVAELQKEVERLATQKNYVSDAFESSRKEAAKLRTENTLANEELARLRRAVEDMQAERAAAGVARRAMDTEVHGLEVERDVLNRALGAATKQLFGKQQQQQAAAERAAEAAAKPKGAVAKKPMARPIAKALASPHGSSAGTPGQQTGASGRASRMSSGGARMGASSTHQPAARASLAF